MICKGCGFGGAEPGVACFGCDYVNESPKYR